MIMRGKDPKAALPIIDTLLNADPGNVDAYQWKMSIELNTGDYKGGMKTGDLLIKMDPTKADEEYYTRMVGAAQADSNSAAAIQYAQKGGKAFPKSEKLWSVLYSEYNKAKKTDSALVAIKAAVAANPKFPD